MATAAPPHSASLCGTNGTSRRRTVSDERFPDGAAASAWEKKAVASAVQTPATSSERRKATRLRQNDDDQHDDDERGHRDRNGLAPTDDVVDLMSAGRDILEF